MSNEESGQASRGVTPQPDSVAVLISSIEQAPTTQEAPLSSRAVEVSVEFNRHSPSIAPVLLVPSSPVSSQRGVSNILVTNHSIGTPLETSDGGALVEKTPALSEPPLQSPPRYDSPEAIYQRYATARSKWFAAQPAGSIKTNQQYRKAMKLPQRYDKRSYEWCLDYKQMSQRCVTSTGSREWTKEELMAYLDWNKAEDERIEAQVAREIESNSFASRRRGVQDIWRRIEEDVKEQEALYSVSDEVGQCIEVKL